MSAQTFSCKECGNDFSIKEEVLSRYPGWTPTICLKCRDKSRGKTAGRSGVAKSGGGAAKKRRPSKRPKAAAQEENLTLEQVLEKYTEGPVDGVFTDGACAGNPGPGGWGTVWVRDNQVVQQDYGHDESTTNNRMELQALIAAYRMLPADAEVTVWSDSDLCVKTLNQWAAGWERRGWKRKTGPVKNVELVKEAYKLHQEHPRVTLRWIKAHNGSRWNEYADSLATAFQRDEL